MFFEEHNRINLVLNKDSISVLSVEIVRIFMFQIISAISKRRLFRYNIIITKKWNTHVLIPIDRLLCIGKSDTYDDVSEDKGTITSPLGCHDSSSPHYQELLIPPPDWLVPTIPECSADISGLEGYPSRLKVESASQSLKHLRNAIILINTVILNNLFYSLNLDE